MSEQKRSFWSTLPGIITGLASILTATVALVGIFMNFGPGSNDNGAEPGESPSPTATGTAFPRGTGPGGTGTAGGAPQAVIAPRNIDFGRLGSGRTATDTVTVANSGSEFLVIERAAITGRDDLFSVDAAECLVPTGIEPGSNCEIRVTFTPRSPGNYAGVLEITHSGPGSPNQVALTGEGALLGI